MKDCPLCQSPGGEVVWEDRRCRVVRVGGGEGEAFCGYCRVIWNCHVGEMTDLDASDRRHLMNVVFSVEVALRALLGPDKINLAQLGNLVPHLHWHVIPRWRDDSHFPAAIWAAGNSNHPFGQRRSAPDATALRKALMLALSEEESGA
jgi:diadenosine tetraphosphate (Ap4A) HIT family hydrolase